MDANSITILALAFAAGLLHALDADHVMAVTAIASKKFSMQKIISLCLKWSLGHGVILFGVGSLILIFGLNIPYELSQYAEKAVAIFLILIGAWILRDLYKKRLHIHFHHHDGLASHAHWHAKNSKAINAHTKSAHRHEHKSTMVGMLHGMAGLAPLLAIVPMTTQPLWLAIIYLLIFCAGIFLSMLVFGGVLGKFVSRLQKHSQPSISLIRGFIGVASISLGLVWLQ